MIVIGSMFLHVFGGLVESKGSSMSLNMVPYCLERVRAI